MSWKCNCGLTNASVNDICGGISNYTNVAHFQVSRSEYDSTLYWLGRKGYYNNKMTDNEDKFREFFNAESISVAAMSDIELIDHISELEAIAFEAKARLTAAKTNSRDRKGKKFAGGDWEITPTQPDATVTDTINRVKLRGERMTKLDKQSAKLKILGFNDAEIEAMTAGLRKVASKDTQEERNQAAKRVISNSDNGDASKVVTNQNKSISPVVPDIEPSKPLDLSKLKFR